MRWRSRWGAVWLAGATLACGTSREEDSGGQDAPHFTPAPLVPGEFTYSLTEGTAALPLWTTPATHRITDGDRAPGSTGSGLRLSAARREFEPAQLAIGPATGGVRARIDPFPDLGADQRVDLAVAGFAGGVAQTLTPVGPSDDVAVTDARAAVLWITVYVPESAPPGEHTTAIHLELADGASISVPVTLYVYDFTLPAGASLGSQLNLDVSALIPSGGTVDDAKTVLFEHRLTPTSVTWPSGLGWNITWDNTSSPTRCTAFYDESDEDPQYSIGSLAPRYILGEGWNGVGFAPAEIFQFVDNATPRPDRFCDVDRGDHYGTDAYNAAWASWLTALDGYLVAHGLAERAYYYVQNEPQNAEDYQLAAHLCRLTRAAAPNLRIAISEEPKPEIAEDPGGACGYDIWIAHVRAYQRDYAWSRQLDHQETIWFYSLDQDPDPYFNPTRPDAPGMHERIIPWVAWTERIVGWAYYDGGRFFPDGRPNVSAELLREGFEDYEYLVLANGGPPTPGGTGPADPTARSVAAGLTSWTKDADALMSLRHQLGLYLEGSRTSLPLLEVQSSRPRGAYAVNFQDPAGPPTDDPLVVDGRTYLKVGWQPYDATLGYGWSGEFIGDPGIARYGYDDVAGYTSVQSSYVYDDYGRDNLFEFAIAPGTYQVTVGVGRPARGYPGDPHNVTIEGTAVVSDEVTTDVAPTIERSVTLDITDGSLSMVVGGRSASTGDYAYTFLAYLLIEPTP
jgi:hypothetical protein